MNVRVVTPPEDEPVSLAEAKAHLRLEEDFDDAEVSRKIKAAREYVEQITWRALVTQTLELTLNEFPVRSNREIRLPRGDVQSVSSVKYQDVNDVEQTFAAGSYIVDRAPPARIVLRRSASWPATSGEINAVKVTYVAGYGAAAAVPTPIKEAILLLVSQMYELRTPEVIGAMPAPVHFSFMQLLSPYRLNGF